MKIWNYILAILLSVQPMFLFAQEVDSVQTKDSISRPELTATKISRFQDKIIGDRTMDTLRSDTNRLDPNHIVINPVKKRKGVFSWRDSVIIPKRSAYYALMFPGLGQLNNKDYWKLPIVYGLLGVGVYFFVDNSTNYNKARQEYAYRQDKGSTNFLYSKYQSYDMEAVAFDRDEYKRLLDLTVLLSVAGYGLQVMEANAAAHLKGFDISDDISMKIRPAAVPSPYGILPGISVAFNLK